MFLDDSEMSKNTNTEEIPKETSNGQDTSRYQLSNGGQIHDVRNTVYGHISNTDTSLVLRHLSNTDISLIQTPL